jgi:hypothetical protein
LQTEVSALGTGSQRTIELQLLSPDGKPQKRNEATVDLKAGEAKPVAFNLEGLANGTQQGMVRIVGQDGLAEDDTRYFTVEVRPAWPVLVAAPAPAEERAVYLSRAVAPPEYRKRGQARFDCQVFEYRKLADVALEKYAAVCLLDPPPLEPGVWQRLADYAAGGRGVGVFLGRNAQPVDSFNSPAAQQVLPGKLDVQVPRRDGDNCLAPSNYQNPILAAFRSRATSTPWNAFPVFRYWHISDQPAGAGTVLPYSDGRPALVERPIGSGRVLMMTTPLSDSPNRDAWNLLPVSAVAQPWPFVILANQMMSYLVGEGQQQLNYYAGQTVVLPLEEQTRQSTYLLAAPNGVKTTHTAQGHELPISGVEQVGNYQVLAGGRSSGADRGFSVNYSPQQTRLDRLDERALAELFGRFTFRLTHGTKQIDRSIGLASQGPELYPILIMVVAGVLALEYVMANRFYQEGGRGKAEGGRAAAG